MAHLNLIYLVLQKFYELSLSDDKSKKALQRSQSDLVGTYLYRHYCEDQADDIDAKRMRRNEIFIIDQETYHVKWWNGAGPDECNAISLTIGEEQREYFYLRYRYKVDDLRWYFTNKNLL